MIPRLKSVASTIICIKPMLRIEMCTKGHGHFPYRRSKDLINWEFMGMAFKEVPGWVKDSLNNKRGRMEPPLPAIENPSYGPWAPCIRKVDNKYRLYYSI
jgi:arabinan endo-1,5-alpha-L-arabinosidase